MMAVWKFAPALAAGNTVVLKPSDTTPVVHAAAGRDRRRVPAAGRVQRGLRRPGHRPRAGRAPDPAAGLDHRLDPGRHGGRRRGRARPQAHPPGAGRQGAGAWSSTTPTSPPPPRRSPVAGYFNAGQDCTAATRVLAGPGVHDDFVAALAEQATRHEDRRARRRGRALRPAEQRQPARPGQPASSTGCPTTPRCTTGGARVGDRGYFYAPTVVSGLRQDDEIIQDEVFGPVITVQRFTDEDEAVRWANGVEYGLAVLGVDQGPRPGDADDPPARLRLRLGQHATSRWSPRCRTAGSSTPGTARTCRCTAWRTTPGSSTSCTTSRGEPWPSSEELHKRRDGRGGPRRRQRDLVLRGPRVAAATLRRRRRAGVDRLRRRHRGHQRRQRRAAGRRGRPGAGRAVHPHLLHGRAVRVVRGGVRAAQRADARARSRSARRCSTPAPRRWRTR